MLFPDSEAARASEPGGRPGMHFESRNAGCDYASYQSNSALSKDDARSNDAHGANPSAVTDLDIPDLL